ncbi:unnamed protein product [Cylicocyclus nassatus]|uniref:Metalloendopeptidase n=1 Tax=Cylicocyclus nassatus TaxID=53992 RepID=A0AA36GK19_CYLNA|nr:unnamed protein product [Cylicocyclus nassatus]
MYATHTVALCLLALVLCAEPKEADETNVNATEHIRSKRLALHPSQWALHLWPGGVVPYEIAPHYTEWEKSVILSGMAEFPKHTCITFRPRTKSDKYYLAINKYYDLERCFSYIGRQTTYLFRTDEGNVETRMKLDPSCLTVNGRGTVMHELMHIIGFYHEHQRDDRDPRVTGSSSHYNYKVYPRASTYYMGAYDPKSIMHYNFPGIVYPRTYFSPTDILRINTLYRCPQATTTMESPTTTSTPSTTTPAATRPTTRTTRLLWFKTSPSATTTRPSPTTTTPTTTTTRTTRLTVTPTTRISRPIWFEAARTAKTKPWWATELTTTAKTPTTKPWWVTTTTKAPTTKPWWVTTKGSGPMWWTTTSSSKMSKGDEEQLDSNGILRRM